jgi:hypothetical protein
MVPTASARRSNEAALLASSHKTAPTASLLIDSYIFGLKILTERHFTKI